MVLLGQNWPGLGLWRQQLTRIVPPDNQQRSSRSQIEVLLGGLSPKAEVFALAKAGKQKRKTDAPAA